jgi:hypothetical protein
MVLSIFGEIPTRTVPERLEVKDSASTSIRVTSVMICLMRGSIAAPNAVGDVPRGLRRKMRPPRCSSSLAMLMDNAGWVTPKRRAAELNDPVSATASA